MKPLRLLVILLFFLPGGACRSLRVEDTHHGAQQHNIKLSNGLEVAAESQEAFIPLRFGTGPFLRAGLQKSALHDRLKPVGRRAVPILQYLSHDRDEPWGVDAGARNHGGGGGGYGGGGRGRGYKYERDPSDTADVDVAAVEALIEERNDARQDRDYSTADAIQDTLKMEHGVRVFDVDRQWRAGGGYEYERHPNDTAEVDVAAVEALIQERNDARKNSDFSKADAILDTLKNEHRVFVFDRHSRWRVWRQSDHGYQRHNYGETGHNYQRELLEEEAGADPLPAEKVTVINDLLAARLQAKCSRDFDKADEIRDQLIALGVSINENNRSWKYKDHGPLGHNYERAEDDESDLDEEKLARINNLLRDRLQAKLRKQFDVSDERLEELTTMGVVVSEKPRGWRADGKPFRTHFRVEGDGDDDADLIAALDEEAILAGIAERSLLRRDGDYEAADAIQEDLKNKYSVILNDKLGTWRVVTRSGGYFHVGPPVDALQAKKVRDLLERMAAHREKDEFEEADAILAEIAEMGFSLNTTHKTWRVARKDYGTGGPYSRGRGGGRGRGGSGRGGRDYGRGGGRRY